MSRGSLCGRSVISYSKGLAPLQTHIREAIFTLIDTVVTRNDDGLPRTAQASSIKGKTRVANYRRAQQTKETPTVAISAVAFVIKVV